jgi:hypothetical protein
MELFQYSIFVSLDCIRVVERIVVICVEERYRADWRVPGTGTRYPLRYDDKCNARYDWLKVTESDMDYLNILSVTIRAKVTLREVVVDLLEKLAWKNNRENPNTVVT